MTSDERAQFFSDFSRWTLDAADRLLKAERGGRPLSQNGAVNPLGDDLDNGDLAAINDLFAGKNAGLSSFQEAQLRELAFWRWVAFEGYGEQDPRLFPLHQEHVMVSTFYQTGWTRSQFASGKVVELGCGPLGMIEYLPGAQRVAFDPLNKQYSRLFAHYRSEDIEYHSKRDDLIVLPAHFDLGICHNVIDHTEQPDWWFDMLFSKIRTGGCFLFQVNTSKPDVPQAEEHRRMHPSPFLYEQIVEWLQSKSDQFSHVLAEEASADGEFHFLAWGTKTKDAPVCYANLLARSGR